MGGAFSTYGREQRHIQGFGGKPKGKRQLGRTRRRWEYNMKMDLEEVGWKGMDWVGVVQDRDRRRTLVNAVMNLRVP